jgi:hypothetical protein
MEADAREFKTAKVNAITVVTKTNARARNGETAPAFFPSPFGRAVGGEGFKRDDDNPSPNLLPKGGSKRQSLRNFENRPLMKLASSVPA